MEIFRRIKGLERRSDQPSETDDRSEPEVEEGLGRPATSEAYQDTNPLGLTLVSPRRSIVSLDVIFVHGLGGGSGKTWYHRDGGFWPLTLLAEEHEMRHARTWIFGYSADFRPGTPKTKSNFYDFANMLLFDMKQRGHQGGSDPHPRIGEVPIIFVAHSMGGLVVKAAYLRSQGEKYGGLIHPISAIVFLATPHNGAAMAETLTSLQKLLRSERHYVRDLGRGSSNLLDLNEQFKDLTRRPKVVSFYETRQTKVAKMGIKVWEGMILEKENSIFGGQEEGPRLLKADHRGVCKYSGRDDPNYVAVATCLKNIADEFQRKTRGVMRATRNSEDGSPLKPLELSVNQAGDLERCRKWGPGTCQWIFTHPDMMWWMEDIREMRIMWLSALPGTGKSTLAAYIIDNLQKQNKLCQYYFFKSGNSENRSLNSLVRSLTYQIAESVPEFRSKLHRKSALGRQSQSASLLRLWDSLFNNALFGSTDLADPLYWVIDALDESASPTELLDLLQDIPHSGTPLRILFTSQWSSELSAQFNKLGSVFSVKRVKLDKEKKVEEDIRLYISDKVKHLECDEKLQRYVTEKIIASSNNNFLWVSLITKDLFKLQDERALQVVLDEIPEGLDTYYEQMKSSMLKDRQVSSNKDLLHNLLKWTLYARRPMTLQEMSDALGRSVKEKQVLDFSKGFLLVNHEGYVEPLHKTARAFLIDSFGNKNMERTGAEENFSLRRKEAHAELADRTLSRLMQSYVPQQFTDFQRMNSFLVYAAESWSSHLRHAAPTEKLFNKLLEFFESPETIGNWIELLARTRNLQILVKTAEGIAQFFRRKTEQNQSQSPLQDRHVQVDLLGRWGTDLVRLVNKFSRQLFSEPSMIHDVIPPLCPEKSNLRALFCGAGSVDLSISGITYEDWNDHLAKITLPLGCQPRHLTCAGNFIALLDNTNNVLIWDADNFVEVRSIAHDEFVDAICFDESGESLITYTPKCTRMWDLPSGNLKVYTSNPQNTALGPHDRIKSIVFLEDRIVAGMTNVKVKYILLDDFQAGWHEYHDAWSKEISSTDDADIRFPKQMVLNPKATLLCCSYAAGPLRIWNVSKADTIPTISWLPKSSRYDRARLSNAPSSVRQFTWIPETNYIVGVYNVGDVFKWDPITDYIDRAPSSSDDIFASSDGRFFATVTTDCTIEVWNFQHLTCISRLTSTKVEIVNLVFSPNCRRIYDLRLALHSSFNAWEPPILTYHLEAGDSISDVSSETRASSVEMHFPGNTTKECAAVTALAVDPQGTRHCIGHDNGDLTLLGTRNAMRMSIPFPGCQKATQLAWSDDSKYVAAIRPDEDITLLKNIHTLTPGSKPQSLSIPNRNFGEFAIHQVLFSSDSKLLFITSASYGHIWAVDEGCLRCSINLRPQCRLLRWINHPLKEGVLLGLGVNDAWMFRWEDLSEQGHIRLNDVSLQSSGGEMSSRLRVGDEEKVYVKSAILSQDGQHVLVQTKTGVGDRLTKSLFVIRKSALKSVTPEGSVDCVHIPPDVTANIEKPLGVLPGLLLAFIDKETWICTVGIGSGVKEINRIFFIPPDWYSKTSPELCCMSGDGTIFSPRDDQVAVIQSQRLRRLSQREFAL